MLRNSNADPVRHRTVPVVAKESQSTRPPSEAIIWAISLTVGLCGTASLAAAAVASPLRMHVAAFAVLVGILTVVEVSPHPQLQTFGQQTSMASVQPDELLIVPMAALLSPVEVMAGAAIAFSIAMAVQRKPPVKAIFNVGQVLLASGTDVVVTHALDRPLGIVAAAMLGGCAFIFVSAAFVGAIIAYTGRKRWPDVLRADLPPRAVAIGASVCLGGLIVLSYHFSPAATTLVVAPAVLLQKAYSQALSANERHQRTEAMYLATAAIRDTLQTDEVRVALLDAARSVLGVRNARLISSADPHTPGALRVQVNAELALEVSERIVMASSWRDYEQETLRALAHVGSGALHNASMFERIEAVTHSQSEGVLAVAEGHITFANPAAVELLGRGELFNAVARDVLEVLHGQPERSGVLLEALEGRHPAGDIDAELVRGDGTLVPVAYTVNPIMTSEGPSGSVVVLRDITERKAFEKKLLHQAYHDPLTGLPNRRLFLDRLSHAMMRSARGNVTHGVAMFDMDRFKLVNDSLGHTVGDQLLVALASRLQKVMRPQDTFARLGGDEFIVLVEDIASPDVLAGLANRLIEAVKEPFTISSHQLFASLSVGLADTANPVAAEDLMAAADAALYKAKAAGKSRWEMFSAASAADASAKLDLEVRLRQALERQEFELHYQPIVETATGRPTGAEALVRWNSPQGRVPPTEFIPLAEETGLIDLIGSWVLCSAASQARRWVDAFGSDDAPTVSVNLSARQFAHPQIVAEVAEVLAATGVDPSLLCLEITESVVMEDALTTIARLASLRDLGVKLSIDDFGVGHSSLSYLKQFPVSTVKIDKSFVDGMLTEAVDAEIVAAIVRLGVAKGFTTVAEGVEEAGQAEALKRIGCTSIQGYLYSRPLPVEEFERFWRRRSDGSRPGSSRLCLKDSDPG